MLEYISVTEAIQLAGRRIYGDDWIAGLTPAERDVMAQYPLGGPEPADSEACAKVARARDRDGRARLEHDRTRNWLKSCGFRTEAGALIDGEALKDALAREIDCSGRASISVPPSSPPWLAPRLRPATGADKPLFSMITEPPEAATPDAAPPGPKPGEKYSKNKMCEAAVELLESGRFPPTRGRLAKIVLTIHRSFDKYQADSIRKTISPTIREWEEKHPGK
jgi:hypothetical protein